MDRSVFTRLPPHGTIPHWLGAETVEQLLDYALAHQDAFTPSQVGYDAASAVKPEVRRSSWLKSLGNFESLFEARVRSLMPAIFTQLGSPPVSSSSLELELVAHGEGAFFSRHIDTATKGISHRVVSCVYYFHAQPKGFSGGQLRLHSIGGKGEPGSYIDVEPTNDTLVFFPSWFPHEVLEVSCPSGRFADSRFAVNCWIYQGVA